MQSNYSLRLKDIEDEKNYLKIKHPDVKLISIIVFLFRALNLIFAGISNETHIRKFSDAYWISRCLMLLIEVLLISAYLKWPLFMSKYHSALLMPFVLMLFSNITPNASTISTTTSVLNFLFFLTAAVLMNSYWIATSIAISITMLTGLGVFVFYQGLKDLVFCWQWLTISAFMIFNCYYFEKRDKLQFLHMKQINKLNLELK